MTSQSPSAQRSSHLPTPPLSADRVSQRNSSSLADRHSHRISNSYRRGILGELEYLIADVDNTVNWRWKERSQESSMTGVFRSPAFRPDRGWWLPNPGENVSPSPAPRSSTTGGQAADSGGSRSRQPPARRPTPLFMGIDDDDEDEDMEGLMGGGGSLAGEYPARERYREMMSRETSARRGDSAEQVPVQDHLAMVVHRRQSKMPDVTEMGESRALVLGRPASAAHDDSQALVTTRTPASGQAFQIRFDPTPPTSTEITVSKRSREDADDDDDMEGDFEITGAVILRKYARVEDAADEADEREDDSTPIREMEPCKACGCKCGGEDKKEAEPVASGSRKGSWSATLPRKVQANILAALLSRGGSLRNKMGQAVGNWADLAAAMGADRGQHDTVRRVAKNMQEQLPERMRRGLL